MLGLKLNHVSKSGPRSFSRSEVERFNGTSCINEKVICPKYIFELMCILDEIICKCSISGNVWHIPYIDVIMTTMASQITSLTIVYSTVYSDADQGKHQRSASLAFVRGIHRDRWIPRTKGQLRGKCFHLMTSSCKEEICQFSRRYTWMNTRVHFQGKGGDW